MEDFLSLAGFALVIFAILSGLALFIWAHKD